MKAVTSESSLLLLNVYIFIDTHKYSHRKNSIVFSSCSYFTDDKLTTPDLKVFISLRGERHELIFFA